MATVTETVQEKVHITNDTQSQHRKPLELKGVLDQFESFDVTPVIGKEFPKSQLVDWLKAPNADELLRDLAITVSQRGVVFFRAQKDLNTDLQKELIDRLGKLSGKPATSGLHIHPVHNAGRTTGHKDDEISTISSEEGRVLYGKLFNLDKKQSAKAGWHSDITFEPIPSDYAVLQLKQLPKTGGDTLWASGYEVYDRISPAYRKFLDTLTATYAQPGFQESAKNNNFNLHPGPRGAPENVGTELKAIHPVIRTNPVTGWKSVFAVSHHAKRINEVSELESAHLLNWFVQIIVENHDLQVRFRWLNEGDLAIWDNRSVYHTATQDYEGLGERLGHRAVSLGERPYLDPHSTSRREAAILLDEKAEEEKKKRQGVPPQELNKEQDDTSIQEPQTNAKAEERKPETSTQETGVVVNGSLGESTTEPSTASKKPEIASSQEPKKVGDSGPKTEVITEDTKKEIVTPEVAS